VVGRRILRTGELDSVLTPLVRSLIESQPRPGWFIDVGANLGWYSVSLASSSGVTGVVAIEPEPHNHELLQDNVRMNGLDRRIRIANCAVGRETGTATMHLYRGSNRGRHSMATDHEGRGSGRIEVPVRRLDDVLAEAGLAEAPIAAIKMDVEGFESEAIAGGGGTLRRAGLLAIEINPPLCPGGSEANNAMLDEIEASGLRPHWCDDPDQVLTMDAIKSRTTACDVVFRRA
jgi:FkbM family methyltransferase